MICIDNMRIFFIYFWSYQISGMFGYRILTYTTTILSTTSIVVIYLISFVILGRFSVLIEESKRLWGVFDAEPGNDNIHHRYNEDDHQYNIV